jgi:hypothetical protein
MNDALKAVIALIQQDKRTTWLAGLVIALFAAGKGLSDSAIEPWGTCVSGLGGFLSAGVLLFAKIAKPEPAEPPTQPPAEGPPR